MRRMSDSEARIACFLVAKRRRSNQKVAHKSIGKSFIMKILEIDYTTKLNFEYPVYDHYFLLRSVPVSKDAQTVVSTNLGIFPVVSLVLPVIFLEMFLIREESVEHIRNFRFIQLQL